MKQGLVYNFTVDKENKTIHIVREFAANLELVWRAWTTAELLDQWWGPEPWRAETKTLDFRVGGLWHYAMVGPEGERHWSRADFLAIKEKSSFTSKNGFCDENGTVNPGFPQNSWENNFIPKGDKVEVDMLLSYDSLADLEKELEMGFKEGISQDFLQLDGLLAKL